MDKQFFILIGRSGCGKGTQAELLQKYLEEKGVDPTSLKGSTGQDKVVHITTGGGFSELLKQNGYISSLSREINSTGKLQPEFLAVWNWSNIFINTLKGDETIILDGAPRKSFEVEMIHSAINFMDYKKPMVIYVDVSENWAKERLIGRGRDDDKNENEVNNRMNWFETDVLPAIDLYIHDPRYRYLHINGEQSIEEVHKEIIEKLNNSNG
jgi:adenylate kinase